MINIEQRIDQAFQLDQQIKSLTKDLDPVKKDIKNEMKESGLTKVESANAVASLSTQERTSMNEDKLVLKLQALGLDEALTTKIIPNNEVIEQLIFEGKLDAAELQSCVEVKYVDVLTLKKAKVSK